MSAQMCDLPMCTNNAVSYIDEKFVCAKHAPADVEVHS